MFSKSHTARFDFKPTVITPGPGSYELPTAISASQSSTSRPSVSHTMGSSTGRWGEVEALIKRSNPDLGPGHYHPMNEKNSTPTKTANSKTRQSFRPSVAPAHHENVRRSIISANSHKRQRSDEEEIENRRPLSANSRGQAEWEIEKSKHAETQRELAKKLSELKDEWDHEKENLNHQIIHQRQESNQQLNLINNEKDSLSSEIEQLKKSITELTEELSRVREENGYIKTENDEFDSKIKQLTLEMENNNLQSKLSLQQMIEENKIQSQKLTDIIESRESELFNMVKKVNDIIHEKNLLNEELSQSNTQYKELSNEKQQLVSQIESLNKTADLQAHEFSMKNSTMIESFNNEKAELESRLSLSLTDRDSLVNELEIVKSQYDEQILTSKSLERDVEELQKHDEQTIQKLQQKYETTLIEHSTIANGLQAEIDSAVREISRKEEIIEEQNENNKNLQKKIEEFQSIIDASNNELETLKSNHQIIIDEYESSLNVLASSESELQKKVENSIEESIQLKTQISSLEWNHQTEINDFEVKTNKLSEEKILLQNELNQLNERIVAVTSERDSVVQQLNNERTEASHKMEITGNELLVTRQDLETIQNSHQQLDEKLSEQAKHYQKLIEEEQKMKSRIQSDLEIVQTELIRVNELTTKTSQQWEFSVAELMKKNEEISTQLSQSQQENIRLVSEETNLRHLINELESGQSAQQMIIKTKQSQIDEYQNEITELKELIKNENEKFSLLTQEKNLLQNELNNQQISNQQMIEAFNQQIDRERGEFHESLASMTNESEKLQNEILNQKQIIQSMTESFNQQIENERAESNQRIVSVTGERDSVIQQLNNERTEATQRMRTTENELSATSNELTQLHDSHQQLNEKLSETNNQYRELLNDNQQLVSQIESLTQTANSQARDFSMKESSMIESFNQEKTEFESRLSSLSTDRDSLANELEIVKGEYNEQALMNKNLERDVEDSQKRHQALKESMELQTQHFSTQLMTARNDLKLLKEQLECAVNEVESQSCQLLAKTNTIEEMAMKEKELNNQIIANQELIDAEQLRTETLKSMLDEAQEALEPAETTIAELTEQLNQTEEKLTELNKHVTQIESHLTEQRQIIQRLTSDNSNKDESLQSFRHQSSKLTIQLQQYERNVEELKEQLSSERIHHQEIILTKDSTLHSIQEEQQRRIQELTEAIHDQEMRISQLNIKNEKLIINETNQNIQLNSLKIKLSQLDSIQAQCQRANESLSLLESKYSQLINENNELKNELKLKLSMDDELNQFKELASLLKLDNERLISQTQQLQNNYKELSRNSLLENEKLNKLIQSNNSSSAANIKELNEKFQKELQAMKTKYSHEISLTNTQHNDAMKSSVKESAELKKSLASLTAQFNSLESRFASLQTNEVKNVQEKMKLERKIKELQLLIENNEKEKMKLIQSNISSINHELQVSKEQNNLLTNEINKLRALLNENNIIEIKNKNIENLSLIEELKLKLEYQQKERESMLTSVAHLSSLTELASHNNPHQRIHLHSIIKEENAALKSENEKLRKENIRYRMENPRRGSKADLTESLETFNKENDATTITNTSAAAPVATGGKGEKRINATRHRTVLSSIH